jgi:hypothetical protein
MLSRNWFSQFLEKNLKTSLPSKAVLDSPNKLIEMVERGEGLANLGAGQMLRHGIEIGRGGVWLCLTEEQY